MHKKSNRCARFHISDKGIQSIIGELPVVRILVVLVDRYCIDVDEWYSIDSLLRINPNIFNQKQLERYLFKLVQLGYIIF